MVSANGVQKPVVAGVLSKYVNMAKGWKDRLFVLSDDKLRYYKLSGKRAVNIQSILEQFDPEGARTKLIGAQIFVLLKEQGKNGASKSSPNGVYELQHIKLRESGSESHKFYIHTADKSTVTVKTETPDDRFAWVAAMSATKVDASAEGTGYIAMDTGQLRAASIDSSAAQQRFLAVLSDLQRSEGLSAAGAASLEAEFTALTRALAAKKKELWRRDEQLAQLTEERRQLQTTMVTADLDATTAAPMAAQMYNDDEADDDGDDDDISSSAASAFSVPEDTREDVDGEAFYDAQDSLSSTAKVPAVVPAAKAAQPTAVPAAALATRTGKAAPGGAKEPSWLAGAKPVPRREKLPEPAETQKSVSLWSIIKECIGKDLTRICLPVYFNEPLSALQKMAEEFQYASFLEQAANAPKGSVDRLMAVALFALSGYAGAGTRTCKPFNPLLGETYEHVDIRRRFRFVAEKVVHHPTILAAACEGAGWAVAADLEVKSKFWGRCIELKPIGRIQVKFHDGETITWNKVTTTINNLILGKIYVEFSGTMRVQSDTASAEVRVKFKDSGSMFSSSKHVISGRVYEGNRELPTHKLEGTWEGPVTLDTGSGPEKVWEPAPPAVDPTRYGLTQFAIELNELTPGLKEKLPPTDCRLRPDQAALEAGYYDKANNEKQRLEKKQRRARKEAEEGKPIHSRWFTPVPNARRGEELGYKFGGDYWEQRAAGHYTGCRDIFGGDEGAAAA